MFYVFVYGSVLLIDLGYNSVRWDELVHCFGGLQLLNGRYFEYLTTNTFYPPLFNLVTATFFGADGASVFSARLVAVLFSLLSLIVLYEFARRLYGSRTALIASILFSIMPGVLWSSRFAYIETMLEFFFLLSLFFFFSWVLTDNRKVLIAAGLTLGLGFLVKYQMLVAGIVMVASLLAFGWSFMKSRIVRLLLSFLIVAAIVVSWFLITYLYAPGTVNQWLYAISAGDQLRSQYSTRFPTPIFYLVEVTWAYFDQHPISLLMYGLALVGLLLLAWRRKSQDKFLLVWFAAVYSVFTVVGNRQWRYVMPLFPVLAISASILLLFTFDKIRLFLQKTSIGQLRRTLLRTAAFLLILFAVAAAFFSGVDAFQWISRDQVNIPLSDAIDYVAPKINESESLMIICPYEQFSKGIASFYLQTKNSKNVVLQYPELPVDTFAPVFDVNSLIVRCEMNNAKYALVSSFQWSSHYFDSTLTSREVISEIFRSGKFTYQTSIGKGSSEILVFSIRST